MTADRREILFTAAERLFSRNGYRDVSVEDITRAAGLGTGSFYGYFRSKEELYSAILDRLEKKGAEEAERHVRRFTFPMNKLKALILFSVLGLRGNPILRGIITRDRRYLYPGAEERSGGKSPLFTHIKGMLNDILREGARKRVFRTGIFKNPHGMLVAVYGAVLTDPDTGDAADLMNDLLLLIKRGLGRRFRLRRADERRDRRLMDSASS
jgi:AcrR family transcriptional regulator